VSSLFVMRIIKYFVLLLIINLFIHACASYKAQYADTAKETALPKHPSNIVHSFYLIGDAGNSRAPEKSPALSYLKSEISKAQKESTLIFLGDNVYEKGIPDKNSKTYKLATARLKVQTDLGNKFPGRTIMIPGNHDWYSGLSGLRRQEKLVDKALGKNSFLPEKGCPLEHIEISKDIELIIIDTHWFVTNWNDHPGINDKCEIKTREKFFEELEGLIKKARGKTTLIAMHHPMFTNGPHGGYYSFKSHITPVPILGSALNILRKTSGITNTDQQNDKYNQLKNRIVTLSQENNKVIFVSGHEHSLQYLVEDNIPQIVSGAGSKTSPTKNVNGGKFSYGTQGFARLDIYKDGASSVHFYAADTQEEVYKTAVYPADSIAYKITFKKSSSTQKKASIYTEKEVTKSKAYRFLWGKRYRKYFGTEINARIVYLDTLLGGLTPVRKGGGHQSKSLRLEDKQGREYVMRALRKNAVQYIQAVAFKDKYVRGQFDETYTEGLLLDIFTGSHPYAPFTIGTLSDAVGIYHANPVLYYIPKQTALGQFNRDFGDELYMIEERTASGHGDKKHFGFSNKIISTDDLRKKLNKSENHVLDEEMYIRARLFDMLIGDWDRHQDQWRWAEFKKGDRTLYRPVPRDRDQAFSIFGDGKLLGFITQSMPALRGMRSYKDDIDDPRWFNSAAYPLDMALIREATKEVWDEQVSLITSQITDSIIDKAFLQFPKEVRDHTILKIKKKLQGRRKNLQKIADKYFNHLNKFQIIRGTNKDDWFDIERLPEGKTKVTVYRIKGGLKAMIIHERVYDEALTKEIWIYGLDDDDVFVVKGSKKKPIAIKIIGGLDNDIYEINEKAGVKVYDHQTRKNTFKTNNINKKLTDDYDTNTYNYKKLKNSQNMLNPAFGYNPDDGLKIGLKDVYTSNSFERNPFTHQQILSGYYYFATNGFEMNYSGEFAHLFKTWNFGIDARYTSPNYAINFFGFGNNSINPNANESKEKDFNRVKIGQFNLGSFIQWRGALGAKIKLGANYQRYHVERTLGRFLETQYLSDNTIFKQQHFINTEGSYTYKHSDNPTFSTLGMGFEAHLGYTTSLTQNRDFAYAITSLSVNHKLIPSGQLVLASKVKGHFTFGEEFEFYQGASIGGSNGLRGYRNERFTGKNSFYHSSDLRLNLASIKTGLVPFNVGVFGGFDYGKVWGDNSFLIQPSLQNAQLHTSVGGGLFFNTVDILSSTISGFHSDDGWRMSFSLGFEF